MSEVKFLKVLNEHERKSTLPCKKCNFNSTSKDSLKIHIKNVHEPVVLKCNQCNYFFLSEDVLKIHKRQVHAEKETAIVIKNSLNPIKGEAGGLSDPVSNPKRGQADIICNQIINNILESIQVEKRDMKSMKPGSKSQVFKKKNLQM